MRRILSVALVFAALPAAYPQSKSLPLHSADGLTLHNAIVAPVTFQGKKAIRVTAPPAAERPAPATKGGLKKGGGGPAADANRQDHLGLLDGVEFSSGTIEVDLAGEPGPGAAGGARGFAGIAFRVQPDRKTYDCFYLRPTNGRSDDQERRNHTAQYIQHPDFPWFKLRQETPSKYESYVDIGPAEWVHVKIEVNGDKAKLFVNHHAQPVLIVNDVKSGAAGKGAVALWIEGSTIAHYANLKVTAR
ncbi:MAG: hypothetical protein JNK48_28030 [Bryobacterales bacterium]|nr:hypothetical protein [Bryobacterales bacterium]